MKVLTKKEQDEVLMDAMQIISTLCGRGVPQNDIEELADCIFDIVGKTSGKRGLTEMALFIAEQIKLHIEILREQNKTAQ